MSQGTKTSCPHCGRDDFRAPKGLAQHLRASQRCAKKERERYGGRRHLPIGQNEVDIGPNVDSRRHTRSSAVATRALEEQLSSRGPSRALKTTESSSSKRIGSSFIEYDDTNKVLNNQQNPAATRGA